MQTDAIKALEYVRDKLKQMKIPTRYQLTVIDVIDHEIAQKKEFIALMAKHTNKKSEL